MEQLKCENCGANVEIGELGGRAVCPYCDTVYILPEEPKLAPQPVRRPESPKTSEPRKDDTREFERKWFNFYSIAACVICLIVMISMMKSCTDTGKYHAAEPMDAVEWANNKLNYGGLLITPQSLVNDLLDHGYTEEETAQALSSLDWEAEAVDYAKIRVMSPEVSRKALITEMESGGYTREQAEYGADNCGADWELQAYLAAQAYLQTGEYTHTKLVRQLVMDGFTAEEVEKAMDELDIE